MTDRRHAIIVETLKRYAMPWATIQAAAGELAEALKKEGDSRAAEMRERAAALVGGEASGVITADDIRSLPLSPAEEKPNAD